MILAPSTGRSCTWGELLTSVGLKAGWLKAHAKQAALGQVTGSVASALVLMMNLAAL